MTEVRIDTAGKIILPKALREAANLPAGSYAEAIPTEEGLLLVPKGRPPKRNPFLEFVARERAKMRPEEFMTKEEVLEACDRALEGLIAEDDEARRGG